MKNKLAVQLYTLREACEQDFPGTLTRLKEMGWPAVQFAGLYDWSAAELADTLKKLGLHTAGLHVNYARFSNELDLLVEEAQTLGTRDLVCPSIPSDLRTPEGYREVRRTLGEAARAVAGRGLRISYHNHAFEFDTKVDGMSGLAYLLEPAADNPLLAEPDVYWIKKGGKSIIPFLEAYEGRVPIIHLKDMATDERQSFAPVGSGSIDFDAILAWCERSGVEWYVVEQDSCDGDPFEAVASSLDYLHWLINERAAIKGGH